MAASWPLLTSDAAGVLRTADGRVLFRPEQALGAGSSGAVTSYQHESTGLRAAIKFFPKAGGPGIETMEREFKIGRGLHHPNIAGTHAAFQTNTHYVFVMELVAGGTLHRRITSDPTNPPGLSAPLACKYLLQLVDALEHMHSQNIVHRDLKPANVVLVEGPPEGYCKLIDFGCAGHMVNGGFAPGRLGYNYYLAPETSLEYQQGPAADVFGLGFILYNCLTGHAPFPALVPENDHDVGTIMRDLLDVGCDIYRALHPDAKTLLLDMLKFNQHDRPTLAQIRASPFVTTFQADALALCPPVPAAAVAFQQARLASINQDLAREAATHVQPQSAHWSILECTLGSNSEAYMTYDMLQCRDAKAIHGAP